ncbi:MULTISPECIES: helix-turn-helix domain-containing protein [Aneurinibacillus]|jgi:transcriptional regulator with XRE-family HTH domain|uniref:Transcriptional regulator n=1 Tax=Aneurinibacillus danicus TaxID=267746 RepID=A0A511VAI9_9BACL|nr:MULTISPECIES: XRE family transcriptional regulator [Aneurinibacillus]GEN34918.1 transcriptional regulator [Aneurinibacillus danicus]
MNFGKNVKNARKEQRLTLEELSERSGVSRSMLSKIEREEKNPTIQVACQIAEALHMTLSQLLGEHEKRESLFIPKDKRLVYQDEQSGFSRYLLSPSLPSRGIEFILNVIPPGQESGVFPPHKRGVKEYITVANGALRVILGKDLTEYDLQEGDSLYFEADVEHQFINTGTEECRYYLIIDSHDAKSL